VSSSLRTSCCWTISRGWLRSSSSGDVTPIKITKIFNFLLLLVDIKNFEELLDIAECYQAQELQRLGFHFVAQHLDMLIEFRLLRPTTSWLVAFEEFYHEHYMNPLIFEGMRRGRGGGDDSGTNTHKDAFFLFNARIQM